MTNTLSGNFLYRKKETGITFVLMITCLDIPQYYNKIQTLYLVFRCEKKLQMFRLYFSLLFEFLLNLELHERSQDISNLEKINQPI